MFIGHLRFQFPFGLALTLLVTLLFQAGPAQAQTGVYLAPDGSRLEVNPGGNFKFSSPDKSHSDVWRGGQGTLVLHFDRLTGKPGDVVVCTQKAEKLICTDGRTYSRKGGPPPKADAAPEGRRPLEKASKSELAFAVPPPDVPNDPAQTKESASEAAMNRATATATGPAPKKADAAPVRFAPAPVKSAYVSRNDKITRLALVDESRFEWDDVSERRNGNYTVQGDEFSFRWIDRGSATGTGFACKRVGAGLSCDEGEVFVPETEANGGLLGRRRGGLSPDSALALEDKGGFIHRRDGKVFAGRYERKGDAVLLKFTADSPLGEKIVTCSLKNDALDCDDGERFVRP